MARLGSTQSTQVAANLNSRSVRFITKRLSPCQPRTLAGSRLCTQEVGSKRVSRILMPVESPLLQQRHNVVDEQVEARVSEVADVEAVRSTALEPLFQRIGDFLRRAGQDAMGPARRLTDQELAHRQFFPP